MASLLENLLSKTSGEITSLSLLLLLAIFAMQSYFSLRYVKGKPERDIAHQAHATVLSATELANTLLSVRDDLQKLEHTLSSLAIAGPEKVVWMLSQNHEGIQSCLHKLETIENILKN